MIRVNRLKNLNKNTLQLFQTNGKTEWALHSFERVLFLHLYVFSQVVRLLAYEERSLFQRAGRARSSQKLQLSLELFLIRNFSVLIPQSVHPRVLSIYAINCKQVILIKGLNAVELFFCFIPKAGLAFAVLLECEQVILVLFEQQVSPMYLEGKRFSLEVYNPQLACYLLF